MNEPTYRPLSWATGILETHIVRHLPGGRFLALAVILRAVRDAKTKCRWPDRIYSVLALQLFFMGSWFETLCEAARIDPGDVLDRVADG